MNEAVSDLTPGTRGRRLCFLAGLCVPLALFFTWQLRSQTYPTDDEGDYFYQAQQMHNESKTTGPLQALKLGFEHRGFRPVLEPYLALPFLFLEGGAALPAARDAETIVYLIFVAFCLATMFLFLPPGAAALATICLTTLPWVLSPFLIFSSDASFLAANAVLIYFAIRSNSLRGFRYSLLAGCALGIASCFRPVEALMHVNLAAIASFLFLCWRAKTITTRDLQMAVAVCLAILACMAAPLAANVGPLPVSLGALAILIAAWFACRKMAMSRNFQAAFFAALAIFSFWFVPASRSLFEWIYACTMGDFIKLNFPRTVSPPVFAWHVASRWVGPHFFLLLLAALPYVLARRRALLGNSWLMPVLALIIAPVLIGSFGGNGDDRRYYVQCGLAMYASFLVFALDGDEKKILPLRFATVIFLILVQGFCFIQVTTIPGESALAKIFHLEFYKTKLPEGIPTNVALVKSLLPMIPAGREQKIATVNLPSRDPWFSQRNNPYSWGVRSQELGQNWRFEFPYVPAGNYSEQAAQIRRVYQWILITYEHELAVPTAGIEAIPRADEQFARRLLTRKDPRIPLIYQGESFRLYRVD